MAGVEGRSVVRPHRTEPALPPRRSPSSGREQKARVDDEVNSGGGRAWGLNVVGDDDEADGAGGRTSRRSGDRCR